MSVDIRHRPAKLPEDHPLKINVLKYQLVQWQDWAVYLESRLAKYETFAEGPKPSETVITKHTAFDPDRRPVTMSKIDSDNDEIYQWSSEKRRLVIVDLYLWALHLESVREGLQRQLNHFDRMYQTDHAPRDTGPDSDRPKDN